MLYILPDISFKVPWLTVIGTAIAFFLMMEAVTGYVLMEDMNETPAAMLRPKAPKIGKEILLEKIPAIWNRLTFSWKVTARNIARYKQRVFMTIIGIAGCTALLVTGFGISDSINDIVDIQYNEVITSDAVITLKEDYQTPEKNAEVVHQLEAIEGTQSVQPLIYYNGKVYNAKDQEEVAYVRTFPDLDALKKIYNMRDRASHQPVEPKDGSVITNEKMAENLGLHVGDEIEIENIDGERAKAPVGGIMELYVFHNVLMTENTYRQIFGSVPERNAILLSAENPSSDEYHAAVAGIEGVDSVEFNSDVIDNFANMIKGINGVVIVLVASSMALAFVVLGNLTNVNISERLREIATLKVLGFRQREVQNYIFKENMILVAAGALVGLPIGNFLSKHIMREIELTNIMFGRQPGTLTFLYAFCLTVLFGLLVNFFMRGKLDQIQMVESLKSVE
jgi:putative ABC transport system permease protein